MLFRRCYASQLGVGQLINCVRSLGRLLIILALLVGISIGEGSAPLLVLIPLSVEGEAAPSLPMTNA